MYVRVLPEIGQDGRVIETADRPWGTYTVLADAEDFKVKTIQVQPGQRLSYQRHSRRSEHWFVVGGEGVVTLDGESIDVRRGDAVDVPLGTAHRIQNTGNVPFVFGRRCLVSGHANGVSRDIGIPSRHGRRMSKARFVITAVVVGGRSQGEVARAYGVSQGWVSHLVARYRAEGDAAFEPRSRRPRPPRPRSATPPSS